MDVLRQLGTLLSMTRTDPLIKRTQLNARACCRTMKEWIMGNRFEIISPEMDHLAMSNHTDLLFPSLFCVTKTPPTPASLDASSLR